MNTPDRDSYFYYVAEEHLLFAQELQLAQTVLPVLGFWLISRQAMVRSLFDFIPHIESRINVRTLMVVGAGVSVIVIVLDVAGRAIFRGTPTFLLSFVPNLAAFALARIGAAERNTAALRVGAAIALLECVRAFLFSFLRGTIAFPLLAFVGGAILGARSLRPLKSWLFVPILIALALFVRYYGLLGEVRQTTGGWRKASYMAAYQATRFDSPDALPQQTVLARLTSFNQLSQVGRLVENYGFYDGRTFEYLRYAFIPRFLWPDKPRIALGPWYAFEIGQAARLADGSYNTSINMSNAGELYLNFGWIAVFPGLLIYGGLLGILWTRARFWEHPRNVLGSVLGMMLMWSLLLGAYESAVFVSLIAVYLCLLALAMARASSAFALTHARTRIEMHWTWWRLLVPRGSTRAWLAAIRSGQ